MGNTSDAAPEGSTPSLQESDIDRDQWDWCGPLQCESTDLTNHGILRMEGGQVDVCVTNSKNSFTGAIELKSVTSADVKDDLASFGDENSSRRVIQKAFSHTRFDAPYARLNHMKATEDVHLRIAARWGEEYEEHSVLIDVLDIRLQKQADNAYTFFEMAFDRIARGKREIGAIERKHALLQEQMKDVEDAERCINKLEATDVDHSNVFMDALNELKQECYRNDSNMVQNKM